MSHITNKKKTIKEKNNRNRGFSNMNTGTRNMGFPSNQDRKEYLKKQIEEKEDSLYKMH